MTGTWCLFDRVSFPSPSTRVRRDLLHREQVGALPRRDRVVKKWVWKERAWNKVQAIAERALCRASAANEQHICYHTENRYEACQSNA